jgi:hypothetical protein
MPPVTLSVATPVALSVDAVGPAERATLENLAQLYVYDWSEIRRTEFSDVTNDGRFPAYPLDAYFRALDRERDHHAFFFRADDRLAGFALVRKQSTFDDDRWRGCAQTFCNAPDDATSR